MRVLVGLFVFSALLLVCERKVLAQQDITSFNETWTGAFTSGWNDANPIVTTLPANWTSNYPTATPAAVVGFGNAIGIASNSLAVGNAGSISTATVGTRVASSGSIVFFQNDLNTSLNDTVSYQIGTAGQSLAMAAGSTIRINNNVGSNQSIGATISTSGTLNLTNASNVGALLTVENVTGATSIVVSRGNSTAVGGTEVRLGSSIGSSFSGNISVGSGVTLSGVGSATGGATIATGATLSPGLGTVGTQSFSSLTFADSSEFAWDLNGSSFDTVTLNGGLTVGANWGAELNISGLDTSLSQSWNVFTGVTGVTGLNNLTSALITLNGATGGITSSNFAWGYSGTNVTLSFTAVPEPSSMALLGVAGLVGGVYARRRQKLAKKPAVAC